MAEKIFKEEKDMIEALKKMDETDIKSVNYIDEAKLSLITDESPALDVYTVASTFGISLDNEDAIEDAIDHSGCIWRGPVNGDMCAVPVSEVALTSLCGRAGL